MKPLRRNAVTVALCCALWALAGCQHKKPVLVVPQQPPPTAAPSPSPVPDSAETAQQSQAPQQEPPQTQAPSSEQPKPDQAQKEKPRHGKKPSPRKPAQQAPAGGEKTPAEVARNTVNKKVIPAEKAEPTPTPGQISPAPTPAGGAQDQAATDQLLQIAETNLNGIKRQLNHEEEAVRVQIKEFITQSHKATTENDPARAYKFALKARLLSDDLARQR